MKLKSVCTAANSIVWVTYAAGYEWADAWFCQQSTLDNRMSTMNWLFHCWSIIEFCLQQLFTEFFFLIIIKIIYLSKYLKQYNASSAYY